MNMKHSQVVFQYICICYALSFSKIAEEKVLCTFSKTSVLCLDLCNIINWCIAIYRVYVFCHDFVGRFFYWLKTQTPGITSSHPWYEKPWKSTLLKFVLNNRRGRSVDINLTFNYLCSKVDIQVIQTCHSSWSLKTSTWSSVGSKKCSACSVVTSLISICCKKQERN